MWEVSVFYTNVGGIYILYQCGRYLYSIPMWELSIFYTNGRYIYILHQWEVSIFYTNVHLGGVYILYQCAADAQSCELCSFPSDCFSAPFRNIPHAICQRVIFHPGTLVSRRARMRRSIFKNSPRSEVEGLFSSNFRERKRQILPDTNGKQQRTQAHPTKKNKKHPHSSLHSTFSSSPWILSAPGGGHHVFWH